jgi:peptidoglycan/xylan/chitin deacetylase (PgdA/CDA1 family)
VLTPTPVSTRHATQFRTLGRRLKRVFRPGALILNYHRVVDLPRDSYSLCVSPQRFANHVELIRNYARPMSLAMLLSCLEAGEMPRRAVVVTFDDGYFDVLAHAKPILEHYEIPATLFAISGFVGATAEMWWDELERAFCADPARTHREFGCDCEPRSGSFDLNRVHARALHMHPRKRAALLHGLLGEQSPVCRSLYRGLTSGELRDLAASGLFEIGAHTVTHPALAGLHSLAQWQEISTSRKQLEQALGRPVTLFSYPHGSIGPGTVDEVKIAGFVAACSSNVDLARPHCDRFRLPRVTARNWGADEFAAQLRFWFEG